MSSSRSPRRGGATSCVTGLVRWTLAVVFFSSSATEMTIAAALGHAHEDLVLGHLEVDHETSLSGPCLAGREQRRLVHQVLEVGARQAGRAARDDLEVDVLGQRHLLGVHLEDALAAAHVGARHHDAAVEAAGAQERRVEHVGAVGRGDDDDALVGLEAVHLDEELVERLLALVVTAAEAGAAVRPTASISSMKMMQGACFLPCSKRSRTRLAPTPTNISTKSEPEMLKNGTPASPAMARASSVLPVPGGPISSTPLGMRPPSFWNFLGSFRNSMISSSRPSPRRCPRRPRR
jgi:hypothetical protein